MLVDWFPLDDCKHFPLQYLPSTDNPYLVELLPAHVQQRVLAAIKRAVYNYCTEREIGFEVGCDTWAQCEAWIYADDTYCWVERLDFIDGRTPYFGCSQAPFLDIDTKFSAKELQFLEDQRDLVLFEDFVEEEYEAIKSAALHVAGLEWDANPPRRPKGLPDRPAFDLFLRSPEYRAGWKFSRYKKHLESQGIAVFARR